MDPDAHVHIRLAEFAETVHHDGGVEVYDEGTVLISLCDGEAESLLAIHPDMAIEFGKQLIAAGYSGKRARKKSWKEARNG